MEITTTLTAPILATDTVTFHVEFESDKQKTILKSSNLVRDGFECQLKKDVSTDYWITTAKDMYVRKQASPNETLDAAVAEDFNNAIANNGKDWFAYTEDKNRAEGDNLCTPSDETDIKCKKIKCVIRRALTNQDPDDMQFKPDDAAVNKMQFKTKNCWIMMNWTTLATAKRKVLETIKDSEITILKGSVLSQVFSYATSIAALTAFTLF